MIMISAPSSSFHDYLAVDSFMPKSESLSPTQPNEDHYDESFDNSNKPNSRNSTVKRPMNAFLLWARGERKRVSSDGYGVSQTSLSKLLGETWRHMSVEEKQPFMEMAESLKRQHHIDYPDYRFKPKQRSSTSNKTVAKKNYLPSSQHQLSTMNSMIYKPVRPSFPHPHLLRRILEDPLPVVAEATPHPIQPAVLAMCQAIVPSGPISTASAASSIATGYDNDWFNKLLSEPQNVMLTPPTRAVQTPSVASRRAVRIQIINKHDDIAISSNTPQLPGAQPTLALTPPSLPFSSMPMDEQRSTLADYVSHGGSAMDIANHHHGLAPVIDDSMEYDILQNTSTRFIDLDEPYSNNSGWIDTPLSNFGNNNSTDIFPTSPYSYDFLNL